jgi:N-acetylmuramoyl-L-alanine amidase
MRLKNAIIHCSATPEGRDVDIEDIRQWHLNRGWRDVGYHFVIKLDGTIQEGRALFTQGAHARGYNSPSNVGICYVGGLDKDKNPKDTRTEAQKDAMLDLLSDLKRENPEMYIMGHRDTGAPRACPCFEAKELNEQV